MEYRTLNNGVQMPQAGFGVFQIKDEEECIRVVLDAIDAGYRLIDTAQSYGNEEAVGKAIQLSSVPREELFITTKVWISHYGYEKAKASVEESMRKLKTDYIDLVLIHQCLSDYYGAYHALEDMYEEGKIKAIGISNFNESEYLEFIKNCNIIPSINQVECHILYNKKELQHTMKKYGTILMGYSPFAQGKDNLFMDNDIINIKKKYNKTSSQVMLRYLIQRGIPTIPKASSVERLNENLDVFDFTLNDNDMQIINSKNQNKSFFGWD